MEFKINSILKELRKSHNMTQEEFANAVGFNISSYQKYERDKNTIIPSLEALCRIADYYHVSVDYLLGRDAPPPVTIEKLLADKRDMSEMEKRFIMVYINLNAAHRRAFVDALENAANEAKKEKEGEKQYAEIPVSCNLASAGTGFELDDDCFRTKTFFKPDDDGDFAVEVTGDSMEPDYPDGCFVLIRKYDDGEYPRIGDVALFICSDEDEDEAECDPEGFIKIWRGDNVLRSINPAYPDRQYRYVRPIGEVRCILGIPGEE